MTGHDRRAQGRRAQVPDRPMLAPDGHNKWTVLAMLIKKLPIIIVIVVAAVALFIGIFTPEGFTNLIDRFF